MNIGLIMFIITIFTYPISLTLEKIGMAQLGPITSFQQLFSIETLFDIATNPYIVSGVGLSVITLLLYLGAISSHNISYLYPFGSLSYIVLATIAIVFLKEDISLTKWAGIIVIVIGAYLINK